MQTGALDLLTRAFPKTPIDPERAFADHGRTYLGGQSFRDHVRGRTWDAVDPRFLETHDDAFGFLGTDALAAVLPAALAALLGGAAPEGPLPYALAVLLTRPPLGRDDGLGHARFDDLLARLSVDQQRVVALVLERWLGEQPEAGPSRSVRAAFESYWSALLRS